MKKNSIRTIIYILLFLLLPINIFGKEIFIASDTPFFSQPDVLSKVVYVNKKDLNIQYKKKLNLFIGEGSLIRNVNFYEVKINKKGSLWVSDQITVKSINNKAAISFINDSSYLQFIINIIPYIIILILLCIYLSRFYKKRHTKFYCLKLSFVLIGILICLRLIIVTYILHLTKNLYTLPVDEIQYFNIAYDISNLNFSDIGNWRYTYGYSLILLPFILIFKTGNYYSLIKEICYFNCIFLSSANIILSFLIIKKILSSHKKAFVSLLIVLLFSVTLFPKEYHPINFFNMVFVFNNFSTFNSYDIFNLLYKLGYTGLSHAASDFMLLLTLYFALKVSRLKNIIFISVCFAFACLIRMDAILFFPLIAFIFWEKLKDQIHCNKLLLLKIIFLSVFPFMLIYLPQLLINYYSRGGFLASPYEMHAIARKTIWSFNNLLSHGINFQISTTFIYVVLGLTGLIFTRDGFRRSFFVMWGLTLYIFYCGYCDSENNSIRFIQLSFIPLVSSFFISEIWNSLNKRQIILIIFTVLLNIIFIVPRYQYIEFFVDLKGYYLKDYFYVYNSAFIIITVVSIFSVVYLFQKNRKAALFLITFLILFLSANSYLLFCIIAVLYIGTIYCWIREVIRYMFFENVRQIDEKLSANFTNEH